LIGEEWVRIPIENGIQRFARLRPLFVEKKCPAYVPVGHRSGDRQGGVGSLASCPLP